MAVGRGTLRKAAGQATVVGSLVVSVAGSGGTRNLGGAQAAISQSRNDVQARGGYVSDGPQTDNSGGDIFEDAFPRIATPPLRMYIASVDRPKDRVDAQFNPESLRETVSAHWNQWDVPGLSHQPLQYGFTTNDKFEFELLFNAGLSFGAGANPRRRPIPVSAVKDNLLRRDRLISWQYLRRQDDLGSIGDTQRFLFFWPNFISLTCVLTSVALTYDMFNSIGQPTSFRVQVALEEIRDTIIYAEDIILGSQRSGLPVEKT